MSTKIIEDGKLKDITAETIIGMGQSLKEILITFLASPLGAGTMAYLGVNGLANIKTGTKRISKAEYDAIIETRNAEIEGIREIITRLSEALGGQGDPNVAIIYNFWQEVLNLFHKPPPERIVSNVETDREEVEVDTFLLDGVSADHLKGTILGAMLLGPAGNVLGGVADIISAGRSPGGAPSG